MIYIQLVGGLGNQMFLIALGYSLSQQSGQPFILVRNKGIKQVHEREYFSNFDYTDTVPKNVFVYRDCDCHQYCKINLEQDIHLIGWFQHQDYFKDYLPKDYFFTGDASLTETDGYFLHIRRGDYVNHPTYTMDYSYYTNALTHFPKDAQFYVISDDIPWCRKYFAEKQNFNFVDLDPIETMKFAIGLRGGICANSSFSWWISWLSKREIVVMPENWINNNKKVDIYFKNVIKC